jgi:hypothetical protein
VGVGDMQIFGTEEATSIPIQIGGGNIDRVANFRVYDKFVGEDQALEIWDAQKDEFGRAKSSMTLHKGRLGIGTEEPEGRLAVLDEPHNFEEFPPEGMTDYDTYIEGHGMFRVRTSNDRTDISWFAWRAFDKDVTTDLGWHTTSTFTGTNNTHDGTESLGRFLGEWVKLEMPHKLQLSHVEIVSRDNTDLQQPIDFKIIGSNDNINWNELIDVTGQSWTQGQTLQFYVTSQIKAYRYIALVCSRASNTALLLREIKYFGTPEQSQSVLHDGELALMKSLTVPRIGPVNNEYPTPKRDKLLLEFNTSLSIHEDLAIDTSGRSNDGTYYGAATYRHDDTFILSGGSGTKVEGNVNGYGGGSSPFSISLWFNANSTNTAYIAGLGNYNGSPNNHISGILIRSNGTIGINHYNNDTTSVAGVLSRTPGWNHIVYTYSGGSTTQGDKIYLNGVNVPLSPVTSGTHSGQTISVAANATFTLGTWAQSNSDMFSGKISNAKVYSIALDRYDIIQLYKQGRVPPVHHLQLVDSTMTIGSHTRNHNIQLDVAGHIRAGGQEIHTFTGQHRCFPDEPVEKGLIVSAKKNRFVKLNGFATGQEAITIDESLPIVSLSNVAEDKACFGVVSSIEKPTPKRIQVTNGIISDSKKERGDNRAIVNSVGEGAIWIVNTGGPLESGDYITTSSVKGYGQYQSSQYLTNFTVAKITMDCDFNPAIQPVLRIKKDDDGMNILDEHGQLQWEEHPTETERAYKIRYLDANGTETDEANAVHIAAFVGCTYHCG